MAAERILGQVTTFLLFFDFSAKMPVLAVVRHFTWIILSALLTVKDFSSCEKVPERPLFSPSEPLNIGSSCKKDIN